MRSTVITSLFFALVFSFSLQVEANDFEKLKNAVDAVNMDVSNLERLKELLADTKINVNARDRKGQGETILHYAVQNAKDPRVIDVLLGDGRIKKNARTTWSGKTALHFAVERAENGRDVKLLGTGAEHAENMIILDLFLLDPEVGANSRDRWARTPLFYVRSGEVAEIFLVRSVSVLRRHHQMMERLRGDYTYRIAHEVDVHARDSKGRTALFEVAAFGTPEAVTQLIERGATVMATDRNGVTPFHMAASNGRYQVLDRLIDAVPEGKVMEMVNAQDIRGETALYKIVDRGLLMTTEYLIAKGADPNIPDIGKNRPLHVAARKHSNLSQTTLLEAGADPNAQNYRGETPLHELVTSRENARMIGELLERGADSSIPNHRGDTPLMLFVLFMGKDIAQNDIGTSVFGGKKVNEQNRDALRALLEGHKASLDASNDRNGESVIQVASRKGYVQARELLSEVENKVRNCF